MFHSHLLTVPHAETAFPVATSTAKKVSSLCPTRWLFFSSESFLHIYIIRPYIEYCSYIWSIGLRFWGKSGLLYWTNVVESPSIQKLYSLNVITALIRLLEPSSQVCLPKSKFIWPTILKQSRTHHSVITSPPVIISQNISPPLFCWGSKLWRLFPPVADKFLHHRCKHRIFPAWRRLGSVRLTCSENTTATAVVEHMMPLQP